MTNAYVWTYNNTPEWLAKNTGIADMLLTSGMPVGAAGALASRLAERYPADTFEVRDDHGTVLETHGLRREGAPAKPRRRALGTRSA